MASTNVFVENSPKSVGGGDQNQTQEQEVNKNKNHDVEDLLTEGKKTRLVPSLRAPASPLMTVTGLEGFVQNWCSGGKKASLLFSSCEPGRKQEITIRWLKDYNIFMD